MALMKCSECGGMVSDKATACPHCGAPVVIQNGNICLINGVEHDLTRILELSRQGHVGAPRGEAWQILVGGHILDKNDDEDFYELWDIICKTGKIPPIFNDGDGVTTAPSAPTPTPKCPVCGSTKLTKQGIAGRAVGTFLFGGFSPEGKAQWICQSCGYKF